MEVHLVQGIDKRFQPWGISVVDETTRLSLQGQVLEVKEQCLYEQQPGLVVVGMEAWSGEVEVAL